MERFRALNGYQKGVLAVMLVMIVVFTILYPININRVGYLYNETILVPSEQDGATVYSGKISGKQTKFTVSEDGAVAFQYGDQTYGPYTVTEDPAAVPEEDENADAMTGIEIRCGDAIAFRGGVLDLGEYRWLTSEDGSPASFGIQIRTGSVIMDGDGNVVDPMEPTPEHILDLLEGPELIHKGTWIAWFLAVVVCAATALSILFADELFRWNLRFVIRNVEDAEPSEWEMMGRYVAWTIMPIMALGLFIIGLGEV